MTRKFFRLLFLVLLFAPPAAFAADLTPPIAIHFTLKQPGFVTLVIEDEAGQRVRNLISETEFPAGENTAYWDGSGRFGAQCGSGAARRL